VETMVGIAALLVGIGLLWVCFALGVYFFTRTGREGMRIQRMEDELAHEKEDDAGRQPPPPTATFESLPPEPHTPAG
jgi:hypothetical protein